MSEKATRLEGEPLFFLAPNTNLHIICLFLMKVWGFVLSLPPAALTEIFQIKNHWVRTECSRTCFQGLCCLTEGQEPDWQQELVQQFTSGHSNLNPIVFRPQTALVYLWRSGNHRLRERGRGWGGGSRGKKNNRFKSHCDHMTPKTTQQQSMSCQIRHRNIKTNNILIKCISEKTHESQRVLCL